MASLSNLTPAEERVFNEALRGLSVKELAERLFLTEATIKSHLAHIYSKLGVRGRLDLLARFAASENGNDGPPSTTRNRRNGRGGYEPGPPKTPWMAYGAVPGAIIAALLLFVLAVWLVETLSVQSTSRAQVEQLINADAVAELELAGGTLEVTTSDGQHLQVAGVPQRRFARWPRSTRFLLGCAPPAPTRWQGGRYSRCPTGRRGSKRRAGSDCRSWPCASSSRDCPLAPRAGLGWVHAGEGQQLVELAEAPDVADLGQEARGAGRADAVARLEPGAR